MKELKIDIILPEGFFPYIDVLSFEESDRKFLADIYKDWISLSKKLRSIKARAINLPEGLSESAFCLEMKTYKFIGKINKANTSFDCYDSKTEKRIQVKACSILPDLTSFGPRSSWDELYFVDFYKEGKWDGTFDIYKINDEYIFEQKMNTGQSLKDQQLAGRRPRFSIYESVIKKYNIKPIKTGDLFKNS